MLIVDPVILMGDSVHHLFLQPFYLHRYTSESQQDLIDILHNKGNTHLIEHVSYYKQMIMNVRILFIAHHVRTYEIQ